MAKRKWVQDHENAVKLMKFGTKAVRLVLVSHSWDGKRSLVIKGVYPTRGEALCEQARLGVFSFRFNGLEAEYRVCGVRQFAALEKEIKAEHAVRRKAGAKKAAATKKKNGGPRFILCPTCGSKSKKLFSEMGGLQTRQCQKGHSFEADTFGGFVHHLRRVANTDRPLYVGPDMSYNDYVYGEFKNNPTGK